MKKRKKSSITRRQFVKQTIGVGLTAAAAGCANLPGIRTIASVGDNEFDYVVVGSGAGGGPVAVNLARAGFRVLLIEAGDKYPIDKNHRNYDIPALHPFAVEDPAMRWDFFVKHFPDSGSNSEPVVMPQQDSKYVPGKGILYPRAGTLGGCTAHNAMVTLYPDNKDWDDIAAMFPDDKNWKSSNMRSYYQRIERAGDRFSPIDRRGNDGWLGVEQTDLEVKLQDKDKQMRTVTMAATAAQTNSGADLRRLMGIKDPNNWPYVMNKTDGPVSIPKATSLGHRNGTRELILKTIQEHPDKLVLSTNSLVAKVLFEGNDNRAVGVEYLEGAHLYSADPNSSSSSIGSAVRRQVRVRKEVILSGGAFNSPQMLMLSGIGPRAELTKHGIDVRVDLPGVGQNLQDRYEIGVVSQLKSDFAILKDCDLGTLTDQCIREYDSDATTHVYSSNGPIVAMLKRSRPSLPNPDLVIFALPGKFRGYFPGWSSDVARKDQLTWAVLKGHTNNTSGRVKLKSANPWDTPDINFNYFSKDTDKNGEDLDALLQGIKFARAVNNKTIMQNIIASEQVPPAGQDIKTFAKKEAWGHHASCSNKMGTDDDPMAVLDGKFRVRGTKGLRVVDASVFPRIPGLFIVVPIYMIAEKASDDILADAKG